MKLLFDANLSPKLVRQVADLFPGAAHVADFGLEQSDDVIWHFAVERDFVIVTKDDDFEHKALLLAPPGKVILIGLGNCATKEVDALLRTSSALIEHFCGSNAETLLVLP